MSLSASRAVLRRAQLTGQVARRYQSTTSKATEAAKDTASKAADTASEYRAKAAEGLSRVTSSAGPAITGAAKSVSSALGRIGGRTGRLIAFVERQIPPTVYYAKVGMELSKLVFQGQKMTPPPFATFQSYFQSAIKNISNPSRFFSQVSKSTDGATPQGIMNQIRNVNKAQLAAGGVILAETLGFFTVGEMIGRFKLVGYRGDTHSEHH